MKKHLFSAIAAIFLATPLLSQPGKITMSLSAGLAIPAGSFSKTTFNDIKSGYATTGGNVQLSFSYGLTKVFSLTATAAGSLNGINSNTLASQYSQAGLFGFYGQPRSYANWQFEKKSWQTAAFLVGTVARLPLGNTANNKFYFTIQPALGLAYVKAPEINGNSKTDTSFVMLHTTGGSSTGFAYMLSAGVDYALSRQVRLTFNCSYFSTASLTFKNYAGNLAATNGGLVVPGVYSLANSAKLILVEGFATYAKQTVSAINPTLGICFAW